ncbi:bifunctional 3-phenylpropionate/cinnamic acid dioxygenase ferredoxin subunit [Williamsia sp. MIQD14]|uniref:bifunctional 3-phenylpropionate/cinnamic acid dioxygenase ferredoxin subunit n=1 Tax=Williamsia sp. MIQD14 TaxID=3425703 RepID=UPI003DA13A97
MPVVHTPSAAADHRGTASVEVAIADLAIDVPMRIEPTDHPPIAVIRTSEGVFAIDDTCTHQDTSLSDGWVENCTVECPLHETCFDLRTGLPSGPPATRAVATHPVTVADGRVHITLTDRSPLTSAPVEDVSGAA